MMVTGNLNAHEIESLMDSEIETHHQEEHAAGAAIARLAGGLPAFGIVAAVLGVVNTMGSVGQPPAMLGGMIGSALVGTFLGILLAYGFVEPLGGLLEQKVEDAGKELQCIKTTLLEHAGLRTASGGRVRSQGSVLGRPAGKELQCIKTTLLANESKQRADAPQVAARVQRRPQGAGIRRPSDLAQVRGCEGPMSRRKGKRGATPWPVTAKETATDHHQAHQEGRPRPPWRRVEDRLCRLRDGDDGLLPADVAARLGDRGRQERHCRLLQLAAQGGPAQSGAAARAIRRMSSRAAGRTCRASGGQVKNGEVEAPTQAPSTWRR